MAQFVEHDVNGRMVKFQLPMRILERIESRIGMGIIETLSNAESGKITLTQVNTILYEASLGTLKREELYRWADEFGVEEVMAVLTELLTTTFKYDREGDTESPN